MFLMYFGNYLLNKNYISKEKFKEIIDTVENSRPRIGVIALHLGYLKPEDIERITLEQQRQNKKFGEIAIELGLLTKKQLEEILSQQPREFLTLAQVLIDKGVFSYEELDRVMSEFKNENQLSDEVLESLRSEDLNKIIESFIGKDIKLANEIKEYLVVFLSSCVRFLTRNIMISRADKDIGSENFRVVYQKIKGDVHLDTYLVIPDEWVAREFVKRYSKVPEEVIDEVLDDSIAEYLNLVNGLVLVNYSENSINCELEPPIFVKEVPEGIGKIQSEIQTDFGSFYIIQLQN